MFETYAFSFIDIAQILFAVLMQYNEIVSCVFSEMRYTNIVIRKNRKNVSSTVRRRIKGGSLSWLRRITSARSVWSLNPCLCKNPATPGEAARLAAISLRPASEINNRKTAVWLYSGLFSGLGGENTTDSPSGHLTKARQTFTIILLSAGLVHR